MKELAKKLATKNVVDVLLQMTGEDILLQNDVVDKKDNLVDSDEKGKKLLRTMFDQFNQRYQDLIKKETIAQFDGQGNIIPINP
jgi:NAD dependent epimerase/dehydratase family enzyme